VRPKLPFRPFATHVVIVYPKGSAAALDIRVFWRRRSAQRYAEELNRLGHVDARWR
jgi:hypothetical protein